MPKDTSRRKVVPPPGLNDVDMNERGERSGPLANYGTEFDKPNLLLKRVFDAWEVKEAYLVNGYQSYDGPCTPKITSESGPAYMLRFGDGKWRFARFAGLNGPPWSYCPADGFEGKTGREAWLRYLIAIAEGTLHHAERALEPSRRKLGTLRADLELHLKGGAGEGPP